MRWIMLAAASFVIAAGTGTADAASARSTAVICPAKVKSFIAQLTRFEATIENGGWSWTGLTMKATSMVLAEKHIDGASLSSSCFQNVFYPGVQAVVQYTRGAKIAVANCETQACNNNYQQQINRAWTIANRSTDRAASNLP